MLFQRIPLLLSITLPLVLCTTHDIVAGDDGRLAFVPNVTHASTGDTLIFHFYPGDHNVAQGVFGQPCQPSPGGFYSGYINPDQGESTTTFEVKVNSTDPLWIYCSAPGHCQGGMVGVINPPNVSRFLPFRAPNSISARQLSLTPSSSNGDQTLDAYAKAAQSASGSSTPDHVAGGVFSNGGSSSQSSASSSASASSSSSAASSSTSASSSSSPAASASSAATSASGSTSPTASGTKSGTASGSVASTSPTGAAVHGYGASSGLGAVGVVVVFVGGWMGLL